jgi:hypothetical protein
MAQPITWQTINAPSFGEANRLMGLAQQSILGAFDNGKTALADTDKFNQELWKRQDQDATQDALGKVYQAQTVDQMNALNQSGVLDQATAANGARIDRAAVNALRDGRVGTLQQREKQAWEFANAVLDQKEAPVVDQVKGLLAQGDLAGAKPLIAGLSARGQANMLTALDQKERQLVERARGDTEFGWKGAEEAFKQQQRPLALAIEQGKVDNIPLQQDQLRAQINSSNASAAASNESVLTSRANRERLKNEADQAVERQRLATALEGNIYAEGVYKDSNTVDLAKIMKDFEFASKNNDTAAIRSDVTSRLNRLAREGIKVKGPDGKEETISIPLGTVKASLLASNGDYWLDGSYGDKFEKELRARLQGVRPSTAPAGMNANPRMRLPVPAASTQGAENPALNDWLAFKNITRSSAEVAPAAKK